MGIGSAMTSAVSGLEAHGQMLNTITDNIVNANTNGFKSSRTEFETVLAHDMGGASLNQIGRGVAVGGVTTLLSQGAIINTDRNTDMAINGNGFFVVKGDRKGLTYTRDGSFRFDKNGFLTNLHGDRVQAYQVTPDGTITGEIGDIRLPFNTIPAKATNKIELHVNLDSREKVSAGFNSLRPNETGQFSTAIQIFDSAGNAHGVNVYFTKVEDSTWEWYAMVDGGELAGGVSGTPEVMAQGTLRFDELGRLYSVEQSLINTSFAGSAIPNQEIRFDFGDSIEELGTGQKGTTAFGSKSSAFRSVQDGWGAGVLADTLITDEGLIQGVYTNGINKTLGQIAIARFEATERLAKIGENQFRETVHSGKAMIGKANTNGRGVIMPTSIELSNVDLAKEFVDMIKAQRGFQASAKSITSANDMLEEIINIKRA